MAFLLYFGSHWVLIIAAILAVVGLGVAAYVLKNFKYAIVAIALAVVGFLYQGAVTSGIKLQMAKDNAEQVQVLSDRLDTMTKLSEKYALLLKKDNEDNDALEDQASETPKNASVCLDAAAAGRVRSIGGANKPKPVARGAIGYSGLLSKGSR